jgi:hypothetical protein
MGTGTAARSLPVALAAWRERRSGRTGDDGDGAVGEGTDDDVDEKVRERGKLKVLDRPSIRDLRAVSKGRGGRFFPVLYGFMLPNPAGLDMDGS